MWRGWGWAEEKGGGVWCRMKIERLGEGKEAERERSVV